MPPDLGKVLHWVVPDGLEGVSLAAFVGERLGLHSGVVKTWIREGCVTVDDLPGKAGRYVQPGQQVRVQPPSLRVHAAEPQALALPIRYRDEALIVVAKPAGMPSHPGPGWWRGSCVNALLHAIQDWPGVGGVAGPGIVHRLDKDTSGLLIFACSDRAQQALLQALSQHQIEREYLAWVEGTLSGSGRIDAPLGRDPDAPQRVALRADGKRAVTHYRVLRPGPRHSLLALRLETGRTHQIRAHLASLGHPVWGDPVYGAGGPWMALHAARLALAHPLSGEWLSFTEAPPLAWEALGPLP
ncbi:MAG: RluA family pseudouridine synthase [Candidatus Melainabacteria bacterium HGW-Melainabacteria-1]|nr:MAG: RluA family pseudouridine synthase [Candidatus Melainabacteria bacterium HGW-Melainabacteria-1]